MQNVLKLYNYIKNIKYKNKFEVYIIHDNYF